MHDLHELKLGECVSTAMEMKNTFDKFCSEGGVLI